MSDGDDVALESLKRDELNERAAALGIEEPDKLKTKADVVEAIRNAESDGGSGDGSEPPAAAEKPRSKGREVYVACESLSWRPHPLAYGTEVSELLPGELIETLLEDGRLTREPPE